MSTTAAAGVNVYKRCNVSEDIIKRYTNNIKKQQQQLKQTGGSLNAAGAQQRVPMQHSATSLGSSKKADLERILLSVPLTDDVASFSDNDGASGSSQTRKFPLYADHTDDVNFCLPSSGYKSAPERGGGRYKIRTNSKAQQMATDYCSSDGGDSVSSKKSCGGEVKRSSSLRTSSVTDRVELFRDKLSKSNSTGSGGSGGGNASSGDTFGGVKTLEQQKGALKSSSLTSLPSANKWNNGKSSHQHPTLKTTSDVSPLQRKVFGKGRPTNKGSTLLEVQPKPGNGQLTDNSILSRSKSFSDTEVDNIEQPSYRRERRLKREAQLKAHQCEKSDSETETEDGHHLTKACLDRLDRRNKNAALRGRRGRIDTNTTGETQDENNNETSSDKTLDSGVFDLYLHNYTEDINKLSSRYDSKEFLLDDTLSLKSGYSSASDSLADSIADSVTTTYDSNDENTQQQQQQQWDGNNNNNLKSRFAHKNKAKSIISNMNKFAVTNNATNNQNNKLLQQQQQQQQQTNNITHQKQKTNHITNKYASHLNNKDKSIVTDNSSLNNRTFGSNTIASRIPTVDNNNNTNNNGSNNSINNGSNISIINKKTGELNKNVNKDLNVSPSPSTSRKSTLVDTQQQQQQTSSKSSASSLNKHSNPINNDGQLTTRNIKDKKQLKASNTFGSSLKSTTTACSDTELIDNDNNTLTNKRTSLLPQRTLATTTAKDDSNGSNVTSSDFNKTIQEKKSILKTASKYNSKDVNNNNTGSSSNNNNNSLSTNNRDRNNNNNNNNNNTPLNNSNSHSGQRNVLNGHVDEIDGGGRDKISDNNKKDEIKKSGTVSDNNIDTKLPVKRNIPSSHLTKKTLAKQQGSTELSLLPSTSNRGEPLKIERKNTRERVADTIHKSVQCDLLSDSDLLNVGASTTELLTEQIIKTDAIDILGNELLEDIKFKYPENFLLSDELTKITSMIGSGESGDIVASDQLKMDNARLQKLLTEVERARSGTIKALLHVNTLLNKVQIDNAQLKSDIEVSLQEKELLKVNLKEMKDAAKPVNAKLNSGSSERWKRDKIELMTQLEKSRNSAEEADRELLRLRAQYKKVKEQLEHSNNAFTTTLKNNLDATKRLESELQTSLEEKQELLNRCNEGTKLKVELESLKEEMDEVKNSHEELQDEKDVLEEKIRHLEKKRKQLLDEQEELQEQISHSQEIIEKLSDAGETLKDRLQKEIKEKEYLQECLEETGQILFQLKINERKLLEDKNELQYELETEAEEKEALQSSLSKTKNEHQDLIDRLQNMTNIHLTVKESLQIANKKEKNYQEQIEGLTKTNHILHYTLEKEKEERIDLQEMMDIIDLNHKKMKDQTVGKARETEQKVGKISDENQRLTEMNASLEKKCSELEANIQKEIEGKRLLEQKLIELEQVKDEVKNNLNLMREQQVTNEKNMNNSIKVREELEEHLKIEQEKVSRLTKSLEQTKKMLQQVDLELSEARRKLEQFKGNQTNLEEKTKESRARLKELENTVQELTEVRDKYFNRMNYYETETKQLRKTVSDQTEEIGGLQLGTQRLSRERDKLKRNVETTLVEFESHKLKCSETLRRLKNEVIELSSKLVEKGRVVMKHKENVDNSKSDLEVLRKILDANVTVTVNNVEKNIEDANCTDIEKINLQILRDTHDKFRVEFQSHVEKLEDMLKDSKVSSDSITVVQSPMSKIKLEDVKLLRSEIYEVHTDVTAVKRQLSKLEVDLSDLKLGLSGDNTELAKEKVSDDLAIEMKLSKLNELTTQIECRHHAVINQNSVLLEKTLADDNATSKDLVRKFQLVSMQGENRQLKSFIGLLQKKYNFTEDDLTEELKMVSAGDKSSMNDLLAIANEMNNTSKELKTNLLNNGSSGVGTVSNNKNNNNPDIILTTPTKNTKNEHSRNNNSNNSNEYYLNSESRRNKTKNLFNQILNPTPAVQSSYLMTKSYSKSLMNRSACTSPNYYSDEEDIFNLPRRSYSVPRTRSRPRSSYS